MVFIVTPLRDPSITNSTPWAVNILTSLRRVESRASVLREALSELDAQSSTVEAMMMAKQRDAAPSGDDELPFGREEKLEAHVMRVAGRVMTRSQRGLASNRVWPTAWLKLAEKNFLPTVGSAEH